MGHFIRLSRAAALLCFFLSACKTPSPLAQKYGNDAPYFEGLIALTNGDNGAAPGYFKKSAEKGSPEVSRRSWHRLVDISPASKKASYAKDFYSRFKDEDSLYILCRELFAAGKHSKVISYTNDVDLETGDNRLIALRMSSLLKTNPGKFKKESLTWSTVRPYTSEHSRITEAAAKNKEVNFLVSFRDNVFRKKYDAACTQAKILLQDRDNFKPEILRDTGKTFLYGSKDYKGSAILLEESVSLTDRETSFYTLFYESRLYQKAGQKEKSIVKMQEALRAADSPEKKDQAIWYILSVALEINSETAVTHLKNYAPKISDPYYFDDFFDSLCAGIFAEQKWPLVLEVYNIIRMYADSETSAHFSYVAARLIQEGLITVQNKDQTVKQLFNASLSSGSDIYYKFLAARQLNFNREQFLELAKSTGNRKKTEISKDAETLLYGLIDANLGDELYKEWLSVKDRISIQCSYTVARYLHDNIRQNEDYIYQSIRTGSSAFFTTTDDSEISLLQLSYPRYYIKEVKSASERFGLNEYFMYALIRSESYFNRNVNSSAGAKGLTQLMNSTADDIAGKLKLDEYELTDADTNITFGAFYLEEMIRRLDNSPLHAFFAYNAGITRVRTWLKKTAFKGNCGDLFLESLPFEETRGYGRKLTGASAMYSLLYYEKTPSEVIDEILR